jgi:hypothetical protein
MFRNADLLCPYAACWHGLRGRRPHNSNHLHQPHDTILLLLLLFVSPQGFTAVAAAALLISTYLSVTWLINSRRSAAAAAAAGQPQSHQDPQRQPEQQQQQQQQERQDGLVFVLPATLLLLTWCAASRLAQYDHPIVASSIVLYYTVSVLPELIAAYILAVPTLAARVALGGRYGVWLQQQQQQGGGRRGSSGSNGGSDAEVGIGAPGALNSKA